MPKTKEEKPVAPEMAVPEEQEEEPEEEPDSSEDDDADFFKHLR